MGNRILKESICMNRKFDELNDFEETVFCRLIVKVDDYGIFLADPDVLTSMLYPWKRTLDPAVVGQAVRRMEELGMVMIYTVDGEKYLKITSWEKHQKMRSRVHRFPTPEEADPEDGRIAAASKAAAEVAAKAFTDVPGGLEEESREMPVAELPLNDSSVYGVTRSEINEYAALYPAVDVEQELRNMAGWFLGNPQRRKTRAGIRRFIISWLARAQDRSGNGRAKPPENPFIRMAAGETDEGENA